MVGTPNHDVIRSARIEPRYRPVDAIHHDLGAAGLSGEERARDLHVEDREGCGSLRLRKLGRTPRDRRVLAPGNKTLWWECTTPFGRPVVPLV